MKVLSLIAIILLVIGGILLGLIGFFNFDLLGRIFGHMNGISRAIYCLIGLSAVYKIIFWKQSH